MEMIYSFYDYFGNQVFLTFSNKGFTSEAKHVWVVCLYGDKWLLTDHPKRGYEFPGGKVEPGEKPLDAAKREVFEETGATIRELFYIGQYKVCQQGGEIIKNIYFAKIAEICDVPTFYETNGPILLKTLPKNICEHSSFSFIMKDQVLPLTLREIKKKYI